jgi:hypothetical protein
MPFSAANINRSVCSICGICKENLWNLQGKHSKASRAALDHTGRGVPIRTEPIGTGTASALILHHEP